MTIMSIVQPHLATMGWDAHKEYYLICWVRNRLMMKHIVLFFPRLYELTEDTFLEMKNHYYSWDRQERKKRRYA